MPPPSTPLERLSERITLWVGSLSSIVIHTLFFIGIFVLHGFGVATDQILLILTTAVSLEAIYLAIFIQMSVNRTAQSLAGVEEEIEDLGEEVEDISEDIDELSEDIDRMGEEVEDIGEDVDRIQEQEGEDTRMDDKTRGAIDGIEKTLQKLAADIENLKQAVRRE